MTTTHRDPEASQRADRLDEIAKALRARMRKEGIPAIRWHMSKMVRGWGDIVQAGVTIRVGFEWERAGYNGQQRQAAHRRGCDYTWRYPTVINLETGARRNSETSRAQVEAWRIRVLDIAREIEPSLVVNQDGTLSLPGKEV